MGSDGLMQPLIKAWEMFPLQFNLVVLNYINMYIHSHTHTHTEQNYSNVQSQSDPIKQREKINRLWIWLFLYFHFTDSNSMFVFGLIDSNICLKNYFINNTYICRHAFLKCGTYRIGFLWFRDDKIPNDSIYFSVTCVWMYVHKCIRASILRGNVILRGLYPLCTVLPGAHKTTLYYF